MRWVLFDMSFLAHRAMHTTGGLSFNEIRTGVVYGILEQTLAICNDRRIASANCSFFLDSRHSFRRQEFPDYKRKRREEKTEEERQEMKEMYRQIDILAKHILPSIGFPVYRQRGLESDDLIASACQNAKQNHHQAVIVTADSDLWQCLGDGVIQIDPAKPEPMTAERLRQERGVSPQEWGRVKAVAGCQTDGVPGLKGIGERTAVVHLHGRLKPGKKLTTIQQGIENGEVARTSNLVILPHKKTRPIKLVQPQYSTPNFWEVCNVWGLVSYQEPNKWEQWEQFFAGQFPGAPRRRKHDKKKGTKRRGEGLGL
jgi:5'-3' exonuclease